MMYNLAEQKFYDTSEGFQNGTVTGILDSSTFVQITQMPQGITDSARIGDKVTGTSLQFRFTIDPAELTTQLNSWYMRITIFIWKDDTTPGFNDLYQNYVAPGLPSLLQFMYPLNHDKKIKRKILYDKIHTFYAKDFATGAAVHHPNQVINGYCNLRHLPPRLNVINYQGGASSVGVNNIWCAFTSNAVTNAQTWDLVTFFRYNYVDM